MLRQNFQRLLVVGKVLKSLVKILARQSLRKQLGSGSKKKKIIPTISNKLTSRSRRDFYKYFSLIKSKMFRYQSFMAVSAGLRGKLLVVDDVLSSYD